MRYLISLPDDILSMIRDFLNNKEILQLRLTCRNILKNENLFTSILITNYNWFDMLKRYIKHRKSIKKIHLLNFDDVETYFPFYDECIKQNIKFYTYKYFHQLTNR